jgi:hypothetical protein
MRYQTAPRPEVGSILASVATRDRLGCFCGRMKARSIALALVCLCAVPAASASAAPVRDCGNYGHPEGDMGERPVFTREDIVGAGVFDIRTRVAPCGTARRMVRRFWNGRWGDCDPGCRRGRFRCRNRRVGDEVWTMRCTAAGGRVVRFGFGA